MGRKKELIYYKGCLKGKYLTDKECDILDKIRNLSDNNGCITDLKNVIYELSTADVEFVKECKSGSMLEKSLGELSDSQTLGVAFMYHAKRLVLGDSVGLGKTVQVCGLCNLLSQEYLKKGREFRYLYLTEKSLINQTRDKMIKFTGEYVELLPGEKKYVEKFISENQDDLAYSVVGSHSLINNALFQDYIRGYKLDFGDIPFDAIFIDESAIVGNTATQTYENAKKLVDNFDYVVVMNATPFETNLRAFYAQLNLCDDSLLPPKTTFQNLYEKKDYSRGPYPRFNGEYKNQHIFKSQVNYRYFARTRKSLGAKMENCTADIIVTPLSSIQRRLLERTSMPQMVYDCPSYFDGGIITDSETTPKIGAMLDLIENELRGEDTIIIYSRYIESQRGIVEALESVGVSWAVMNGSTSLEERSNIISRFKMGDFRVLVTNVQKGLDFGHCNACIFYSYDPNPNKMVQFEGRITRSTDIVGKKVYLLISKGKELNNFKKVVSDRAKASDIFAGSDFSCVLSLILDSGKLDDLK